MIFSVDNHVELVVKGRKTQTRRQSGRYKIGRKYSVQPKRTMKGIKEGKIVILNKRLEHWFSHISITDAEAEGGYTPQEFEELYEKMHPEWDERFAYTFRFVPRRGAVVEEEQ